MCVLIVTVNKHVTKKSWGIKRCEKSSFDGSFLKLLFMYASVVLTSMYCGKKMYVKHHVEDLVQLPLTLDRGLEDLDNLIDLILGVVAVAGFQTVFSSNEARFAVS